MQHKGGEEKGKGKGKGGLCRVGIRIYLSCNRNRSSGNLGHLALFPIFHNCSVSSSGKKSTNSSCSISLGARGMANTPCED